MGLPGLSGSKSKSKKESASWDGFLRGCRLVTGADASACVSHVLSAFSPSVCVPLISSASPLWKIKMFTYVRPFDELSLLGQKNTVLTCDPSVRSRDCRRRAKASARPRQDIPSGMKEVIPQGLSLLAASSGAFIYLYQLIAYADE